jgi:hypothetical protein
MATIKVSQLPLFTDFDPTDLIPVSDLSAGVTKAFTIEQVCSGNAGSATKLLNARNINISGTEFTGTATLFDGTADISIPLILNTTGVGAGTYTQVTVDTKGRVTSASNPTTLSGYGITDAINVSQKGVANGVATLDANALVPSTQLPSYVDDVLEFANLASFPATGETGKIYVALDTNKTYRWSGSTYIYITSGAVDSVAGKTGVVVLDKTDVGLGNVDNTSDLDKPISTATQTALNLKADKATTLSGYGITDAYTKTETDTNIVGLIDDINISVTKTYSNYKIQQLHDAQAQAIANLASAQASIHNTTTPVFNPIPLVDTQMPFSIGQDTTNTNVFVIDDLNDTMTLLKDISLNFLSTVTFSSSTNSTVNVTFKLVNIADNVAFVTQTIPLSLGAGNTEVIPMNTLITPNLNGVPAIPFTFRIDVSADISGITIESFASILTTSNTTSTGGSVISIVDDNAIDATYYPTLATASGGTITNVNIASTKLTFNPSSGQFSATSFNSLSDIKFKTNIENLESCTDIINAIRPVSFNWKDTGEKSYGVIAQELEAVVPELVINTEDKKTVNYDGIIPFLIGTIKELEERIKILEEK